MTFFVRNGKLIVTAVLCVTVKKIVAKEAAFFYHKVWLGVREFSLLFQRQRLETEVCRVYLKLVIQYWKQIVLYKNTMFPRQIIGIL